MTIERQPQKPQTPLTPDQLMKERGLKSVDPNQAPLTSQDKVYTLRDLQKTTSFPDINGLRARVNYERKKHPEIKIGYIKGGPRSNRIMVMPEDTFKKLAVMIKPKSKKEEMREESANQTKTPHSEKVGPFDHEQDIRPILGKSEEKIEEELSIETTTIILSHLAADCMEKLTKDPKELLENRLSQYFKTRLDSIISIPPGQFIVDNLVKVLKALWNKDTNHTNSVHERSILDYCFELKKKGYNIESIIDAVSNHFRTPNPFTSPAVL